MGRGRSLLSPTALFIANVLSKNGGKPLVWVLVITGSSSSSSSSSSSFSVRSPAENTQKREKMTLDDA